jgi:hypothetical protein
VPASRNNACSTNAGSACSVGAGATAAHSAGGSSLCLLHSAAAVARVKAAAQAWHAVSNEVLIPRCVLTGLLPSCTSPPPPLLLPPTDDGLAAVAAGCSSLSCLALFRCYSCSDSGLLAFPRSGRRLRSLVLHNCPQVQFGCRHGLNTLGSWYQLASAGQTHAVEQQ